MSSENLGDVLSLLVKTYSVLRQPAWRLKEEDRHFAYRLLYSLQNLVINEPSSLEEALPTIRLYSTLGVLAFDRSDSDHLALLFLRTALRLLEKTGYDLSVGCWIEYLEKNLRENPLFYERCSGRLEGILPLLKLFTSHHECAEMLSPRQQDDLYDGLQAIYSLHDNATQKEVPIIYMAALDYAMAKLGHALYMRDSTVITHMHCALSSMSSLGLNLYLHQWTSQVRRDVNT